MNKIIISLIASFFVVSACTKAVKHEAVESTLPMIMVVDPHVVVAKCDHKSCARDVIMDDGLVLIYKYMNLDLGFTGYITHETLESNIHPEDISKDIPEERNLLIFIDQFYEILNADSTHSEEHEKCEHHDEIHKKRKLDM